ncbi:glycosyltransferase family 1 protein [Methylophilus flavus]|uniref:Glycosyltransferase family 1 protein n=1 Tax=Methylophilus flavus TaxID=640084 RepID=A0ABW3PAJ5_9PROT
MSRSPFEVKSVLPHEALSNSGLVTLTDPTKPTLLCLSHLRWNFVYQRPQHLMSRFAKMFQVLFFEEPVLSEGETAWLEVKMVDEGVRVLIPHLPAHHISTTEGTDLLRNLLDRYLMIAEADPILWYYTPMSLAFTDHLNASLVVYDCMDELSAFLGAPPALLDFEKALFKKADIVFTGGYSLYETKRKQHQNVHPMPSSVDVLHFGMARLSNEQPLDQANIPGPKIGFYGVIDERIDVELLRQIATARPEWQLIMIGPIVKIDPATLPRLPNIHYLGPKAYGELPLYLCGWEVALMPFAINQSTRYISPTKTPEYLAGGRPVVSTPIHDVVHMYGESDLVLIAGDSEMFIESIEIALIAMGNPNAIATKADTILRGMSWDKTWQNMYLLMEDRLQVSPAKTFLNQVTQASPILLGSN